MASTLEFSTVFEVKTADIGGDDQCPMCEVETTSLYVIAKGWDESLAIAKEPDTDPFGCGARCDTCLAEFLTSNEIEVRLVEPTL